MTHAAEPEPHTDEHQDPLEDSELARRLRRMEWPTAPVEVKERCLAEILARVEAADEKNGGRQPDAG